MALFMNSPKQTKYKALILYETKDFLKDDLKHAVVVLQNRVWEKISLILENDQKNKSRVIFDACLATIMVSLF